MIRRALFALFILAANSLVYAQQQYLTPELLYKLGRVNDPQVSPDGKTVIYGVRNTDLAANKSPNTVYSIPVSGGTPKVIADGSENIFNIRWRPDGKKLGYLSAKSGEVQMWEMNPDGSGRQQITDHKGGISLFIYSPAMNRIIFGADVQVDPDIHTINPDLPKTTGRVYNELNYRHWDTWNDGTYQHLFVVNYSDGKTTGDELDILGGKPWDSPLKPFDGDEDISWRPDGNAFAYTCKKMSGTEYVLSTNSDIYLYDVTTNSDIDLTSANKGYDKAPLFSPNGKYLAWLSMEHEAYEADKNRIMIKDMGTGEVRELTAGFDQSTGNLAWSVDGNTLYFISGTNATEQVYGYNLRSSKGKSAITQLTFGVNDYTGINPVKNGKSTLLVGSKMSMSYPTELYVIDPAKKSETQLTFTNREILSKLKMGEVRKRLVTSTDGKKIFTWVVYPPDFDSTKKYPALLYCQGGPQSTVSQFWSTRWNLELMAANGYIVVAPNRRGLPSFGQEWNDAIVGDYGGQPMADLNSAIDNVAKEKYVDNDRLGCVGASFGGYSVYWLAGHNQDKKFKCFIAHDGMFNMISWYGSTEEMWFANHDQRGSYWTNPTNYQKFSPHNYVQNWNTPILIITNEKDFRVPLEQGLEAFTAAQILHIPSRLLVFPDENHWVLKPQNSVLWHREFYEWLDKWLKNPTPMERNSPGKY